MRIRSGHAALFAGVFGLLIGARAAAQDERSVLADYTLTTWTEKDGLASNVIRSIAESGGYLWISTDAGVMRFDGARFVPWDATGLPHIANPQVRIVYGARDGSLWLGHDGPGGITRVRGHQMTTFGEADGVPKGPVTVLAEEVDGSMWAKNASGLLRFLPSAPARWSVRGGCPTGLIAAVADAKGLLYVATNSGVFVHRPGRANCDPVEVTSTDDGARAISRLESSGVGTGLRYAIRYGSIALGTHDRLWLTDPITGFRQAGTRRDLTQSFTRGRGQTLLYDRQGNLWVATGGQGLWRVRGLDTAHPRVDRLTSLNGLPGDGILSLFEDQLGDIWVGTRDGLTRLAPHQVTGITSLGLVDAVGVSGDGSAWLGTVDRLVRFPRPDDISRRVELLLGGDRLRALHSDRRGQVWFATDRGLFRVFKDTAVRVPLPAISPALRIDAIANDEDGAVWLADGSRGLLRWANHRLEPISLPSALDNVAIVSLYLDRAGTLWICLSNGQIAAIDRSGEARAFGGAQGARGGVYQAVLETDRGALWFGGTQGLSRYEGGAFKTLIGRPLSAVRTVVEDSTECLWLGTDAGVVHIRTAELDHAFADAAYDFHYTLYDKSDGLAGRPRPYGNSVRLPGGTLWFVTTGGVTIIDPSRIIESPPPPPVRIEGVLGKDGTFFGTPGATLPAGTSALEVDYTIQSLMSSTKTRFRYRLEGFDPDWTEAGTRRQAFYTNLPPGRYRFRVQSDHTGVWTEPGAQWAFSIAPMFYQTTWFRWGGVASLGFAIWTAWQLRLRRVRKEFQLLIRERARLSREIHDTLLQSLVGVALQCEAIASDLDSSSPPGKETFVRLRREVEGYIREARQSILDLRSPSLERRDLVTALREAAERASSTSQVHCEVTVTGSAHRCAPIVEEQILRIGQEAVLNAVRHAKPTAVRVELVFDHSSVAVKVVDDGIGFESTASTRDRQGHYGLSSMKERAEQLGGSLAIESHKGAGTCVQAIVPSWPVQ